MFFLDLFLETEGAGVGDQVDLQVQEVLHDSFTDSCLTFPYSSNSPQPFPQAGPSIFAGISSQPLPSRVTPRTVPVPFSFTGPQSGFGSRPFGRSVWTPRDTPPRRRRAPRGRRSKITSTASCQTSPIPSYFWPDFQPRRASCRGPSTDGALDLALMPSAYSHFPTSLPLDPLHFDFFTILRVASPVVTFHCPSPLTQKSFSFVYSIHFPSGEDAKPLLVAGILQQVLSSLLYFVNYTFGPLYHFDVFFFFFLCKNFVSFSFRFFKEYEERYLFLFDLDLKPEGEILHPNFNSRRELSLLKEHFL